jgi:hypothetical protein
MSKNKTEYAIIKYLILSCLSQKSLRCDKVRKLKCSFPDVGAISKPVREHLEDTSHIPSFSCPCPRFDFWMYLRMHKIGVRLI